MSRAHTLSSILQMCMKEFLQPLQPQELACIIALCGPVHSVSRADRRDITMWRALLTSSCRKYEVDQRRSIPESGPRFDQLQDAYAMITSRFSWPIVDSLCTLHESPGVSIALGVLHQPDRVQSGHTLRLGSCCCSLLDSSQSYLLPP